MRNGAIYIAEDDPDVRELLRVLIEGWGWRAVSFADGQPCLDAALAVEPACLVTDLDMPGLHGWNLIATLRLRLPEFPIIVVTAASRADVKEKLGKLNAEYVCKPFEADDLHELLKRAMT